MSRRDVFEVSPNSPQTSPRASHPNCGSTGLNELDCLRCCCPLKWCSLLGMVLPTWNGAPYLEVVAKGWVNVRGYGTARMLRLSFVFLVTSVALQTPRRLYRWSWSRHCILGGEGPRSTVPRPKKPRLLFETVSLCNFDWFGTCCIDEAGLSHRDHLLCCHSSVIKEVHPTPGPCF